MASQESVSVVVRVRPLVGREHLRGAGKNPVRAAMTLEEGAQGCVRVNRPACFDATGEGAGAGAGASDLGEKHRAKEWNISCRYDHVFGPDATQEQVYADCVSSSVDAVLRGINCTVFAYGQTGTGKSFTILGEGPEQLSKHRQAQGARFDPEKRGLIPRAVTELFESLDAQQQHYAQSPVKDRGSSNDAFGATADKGEHGDAPRPAEPRFGSESESDGHERRLISSTVYCSYLQIYNEQLFDLLQDQKRQFPLRIRTNKKHNYVQGLSEIRVSTLDDIYQVLRRGAGSRAVRATDYNEASSRSHAILQLRVDTEEANGGVSQSRVIRSAKFNFVDLAGSEKWSSHSDMDAVRLKELRKINKSLSALGNVVQALGETHRPHIPYRDSKLTHLLKDSLGGNTRTSIICTLSPSLDCLEETVSTLQFADRAKQVMVKVKVNEVVDDSVLLARAQAEIVRLKRLLRSREAAASKLAQHQLLDQVQELRSQNLEFRDVVRDLNDEVDALRAAGSLVATSPAVRKVAEVEAEVEGLEEEAEIEVEAVEVEAKTAETGQRSARVHSPAPAQQFDMEPAPSDILGALKEELHDDGDDKSADDAEVDGVDAAPETAETTTRAETTSRATTIARAEAPGSMSNNAQAEEEEDDDDDDEEVEGEEASSPQEMNIDEMSCFEELHSEMEQLESLTSERQRLEQAMRLLKVSATRQEDENLAKRTGDSSVLRIKQKQAGGKKVKRRSGPGPAPPASTPPVLKLRLKGAKKSKQAPRSTPKPKSKPAPTLAPTLFFTPADVGKDMQLYQCRVDAWYGAQVVSYDGKSGMHLLRYQDDGSRHWHQMEGRKYKLETASSSSSSLVGAQALHHNGRRFGGGRGGVGGTPKMALSLLKPKLRPHGRAKVSAKVKLVRDVYGAPTKKRAAAVAPAGAHAAEQMQLLGDLEQLEPNHDGPDADEDILSRLEAEGLSYA